VRAAHSDADLTAETSVGWPAGVSVVSEDELNAGPPTGHRIRLRHRSVVGVAGDLRLVVRPRFVFALPSSWQ
jgi:hypothetical protein